MFKVINERQKSTRVEDAQTYLEIGQRNGFYEVKTESNAKNILQDPNPSTTTQKGHLFSSSIIFNINLIKVIVLHTHHEIYTVNEIYTNCAVKH